jgi:hypothetical protein
VFLLILVFDGCPPKSSVNRYVRTYLVLDLSLITKSRISLNAGTLNQGFTVSSIADKNKVKQYEILASHRGVAEDPSLQVCDTVILKDHSVVISVNVKALQSFEML